MVGLLFANFSLAGTVFLSSTTGLLLAEKACHSVVKYICLGDLNKSNDWSTTQKISVAALLIFTGAVVSGFVASASMASIHLVFNPAGGFVLSLKKEIIITSLFGAVIGSIMHANAKKPIQNFFAK